MNSRQRLFVFRKSREPFSAGYRSVRLFSILTLARMFSHSVSFVGAECANLVSRRPRTRIISIASPVDVSNSPLCKQTDGERPNRENRTPRNFLSLHARCGHAICSADSPAANINLSHFLFFCSFSFPPLRWIWACLLDQRERYRCEGRAQ